MKTLPEAQKRMAAYGAKPVYLVDHPIATDPRSIEILRRFRMRASARSALSFIHG
jgi:hypothetical protein